MSAEGAIVFIASWGAAISFALWVVHGLITQYRSLFENKDSNKESA